MSVNSETRCSPRGACRANCSSKPSGKSDAVAKHEARVTLACRAFGVSETCYRYSPLLSAENDAIADLLLALTEARKTWGFGLCFLHLRTLQGQVRNHKQVCRIFCALALNLRIRPSKRLERDKADALAVAFSRQSIQWIACFTLKLPQHDLVDGRHRRPIGRRQGVALADCPGRLQPRRSEPAHT